MIIFMQTRVLNNRYPSISAFKCPPCCSKSDHVTISKLPTLCMCYDCLGTRAKKSGIQLWQSQVENEHSYSTVSGPDNSIGQI